MSTGIFVMEIPRENTSTLFASYLFSVDGAIPASEGGWKRRGQGVKGQVVASKGVAMGRMASTSDLQPYRR